MRPILALLGAVVLLASGCETTKEIVNPTVAQLEQFKNLAAQGRYEEIEASNVDCKAPQPGCAQLHWIQADACYRLATGNAPPVDGADGRAKTKEEVPATQRRQLDCAIMNYDAALTGLASAPDPNVNREQVELALLESLRRRRDLAESMPDAVRYNTLLREQAVAAENGPIGRPAGHYYAANALLNETLRRSSQGGCAEIADAAEQLRMAQAEGTPFEQAANSLSRAIANARTARKCTP
jgi:hypothetical protein